MDLWDSI